MNEFSNRIVCGVAALSVTCVALMGMIVSKMEMTMQRQNEVIEILVEKNRDLMNRVDEAIDIIGEVDSTVKSHSDLLSRLEAEKESAEEEEVPVHNEYDPYVDVPDWKRLAVEKVVEAEAGNQSLEGRKCVAQCIYEKAVHDGIDIYSVAYDLGMYTKPKSSVSELTHQACVEVFDEKDMYTSEPIMYFYSTAGGGYSKWHETSPNLSFCFKLDDHKYFKLAGT